MKYQTDSAKISLVQMVNELKAKEVAKKATAWQKELETEIDQLRQDYAKGASEPEIRGRRMYVHALIDSIESLGKKCPEKIKYESIIKPYR